MGLGRLSASVDVLQIDPTLSYQLTDRLAVGFAPTVTVADLGASPLYIVPRNSDGMYPEGYRHALHLGRRIPGRPVLHAVRRLAFRRLAEEPAMDGAVPLPTQDSLGRPQLETFRLDYPLIASVGGSYTGFESWILGCDVRYFNYAGTAASAGGFAPNGERFGLEGRLLGGHRRATAARPTALPPPGLLLQ